MEIMETKKRIFICDDDERLRNHHQLILQEKYDISLATNGDELLNCLSNDNKYDLVLLDNNMPGTTGLEVLKRIKSNYPRINVIMVSGDNIRNESLRSGASDFLEKPTSIKDIQEKVRLVLWDMEKRQTIRDLFNDLMDYLTVLGYVTAEAKDNVILQDLNALSKEDLIKIIKENSHLSDKSEAYLIKIEKILTSIHLFLHDLKIDQIDVGALIGKNPRTA